MKKTLLLVVLTLLLAQLALGIQPESFKNLAGTAAEMDAMRLPAAETLGTRSAAAMLPIRFRQGKWTIDLPIEAAEQLKLTLLAPNSQAWQITANADGRQINLRENVSLLDYRNGEVGFDGVKYPAEVFEFDYARTGTWRIEIAAPKNSFREGETAGYLVVSNNSPYQIYTYLDTFQTLVGRQIGVVTSIFDNSVKSVSTVNLISPVVETAEAELRLPNGTLQKLSLSGNENGTFGGAFVPPMAGQYTAQITVRGITPRGERFVRTSETAFDVLAENVRLGKSSYTNLIDQTRMSVNIPTAGLASGRKVVAYAEVWGRNSSGEEAPVAWIGGMTVAEGTKTRTSIPLTLDGRWLARSDAKNDFELRNIRLQDADTFVTLAEAETISLAVTALPEAAKQTFNAEINDEMRMGKRPANLDVASATGGKLMLVHGYCSGGNPFPVSQFSSAIVFSDPNKNRTHDQFANLIKNFGAAYPSFGIVAHSQGGAASLHLYTYYWSGLDAATGSRLIQSVGTPYQGTALAGNLALLGQIFGAGCGSNTNMSYSGAAAWLAGIPTWARAKVNYYTTSFEDVWYRYDYCNLATDPFLGDPEDGVVERAYAQLPSAINRGHKTGWCHTGGMRDPAQTSDSARNAEMNTNAAR
ncbi:MAG TPA: hypothetical protein VGC76_10805 [Pyrinomonadaceae bacterium]|jgi:hypothetical protein